MSGTKQITITFPLGKNGAETKPAVVHIDDFNTYGSPYPFTCFGNEKYIGHYVETKMHTYKKTDALTGRIHSYSYPVEHWIAERA